MTRYVKHGWLRAMTETQLMTRNETADLLKVTTKTLQRWERDGTLEPVRIGGVVRYRRADIEELIGRKSA